MLWNVKIVINQMSYVRKLWLYCYVIC